MTSFYPAINGRATSQLGMTRMLFQIHHDQLAIQDLESQISTGRRISSPSQDPAAAIRGMAAQRQLEYKAQLDHNLDSANTILAATESTLSQSQAILTEIRGLAVQSVNSNLLPQEKNAYLAQIDAAIDKLTELGNAKFRDQYIFGGSGVLAPPLDLVDNGIQFRGNAEELRTVTDYASTISANISANDAFGVRSSKVVSTVDLNPSVSADTPLALLNRGEGIRGGAISFTNGVDAVEIDLADAHDLSDVMSRIESIQVGGRNLQATLSAQGLNVAYEDGSTGLLRIGEVGSGTMAADLGINNLNTSGLSPITGKDLDPQTTNTTRLSQLFAGSGLASGATFQIQQGSRSFVINTNGLNTVEDLLNRIHRSGAQVQANLDSTGRFLQLQSTESGSTLSIGENGGQLASTLGLRTMDVNTPVGQLNFGQGIFAKDQANDLIIKRTNGSEMLVNLDGVQTVGDVLSRINNHVDNFTASLRVTATLATSGNGLVLTAPSGVEPIQIKNAGGSQAAWGLGLVAQGSERASGVSSGSNSVIRGADVSGVEVEGVFTSLLRMREAVHSGSTEDLERITAALDVDEQRMSMARSLVGTRQQAIERMKDLSAEQQVQLKGIESQELDADLAQVISELTARQTALEASLQLMGQSSRRSLFDYL